MAVVAGWPPRNPGKGQDLSTDYPYSSFLHALDRELWPRHSIVLELGAGNGWWTGALLRVLGTGGKIFTCDEGWKEKSDLFEVFASNRWNDKEKIIPLRGSYARCFEWIGAQKGVIDHIVVTDATTDAEENAKLLASCWKHFPGTTILGRRMILDLESIAAAMPSGLIVEDADHFVWRSTR